VFFFTKRELYSTKILLTFVWKDWVLQKKYFKKYICRVDVLENDSFDISS